MIPNAYRYTTNLLKPTQTKGPLSKSRNVKVKEESSSEDEAPEGEAQEASSQARAKKITNGDMITDIMFHLKVSSMEEIRHSFEEKGEDGLEMQDFVFLLENHLPTEALGTKQEVIECLCELFVEIDINGDGSLQWEEFTGFIIDNGMVEKDSLDGANVKAYFEASLPPQLPQRIYEQKAVETLTWLGAPLEKLCMMDKDSKVLNVFHPDTGDKVKSLTGGKGAAVSCCVLPRSKELPMGGIASSSSSESLMFWDAKTWTLKRTIKLQSPQTCLLMDPTSSDLLFSGSVSGCIYGWAVNDCLNAQSRETHPLMEFTGHPDTVTDLCFLKLLNGLLSASVDTKARLWDLHTGVMRKEFAGHRKAILSIAYQDDHRFIATAGFDHDALLWNPFVEKPVFRLQGHQHPLVKVLMLPNTPQILTADIERTVKIWDCRNFRCMQTISFNEEGHSKANDVMSKKTPLSSMCYIPKMQRIMVSEHKLHCLDYDIGGFMETTADKPLIAALYNEYSNSILTATAQEINIWDAFTGRVIRIYTKLSDHPLTCVTLDIPHRKFITGDHGGGVKVWHYTNGLLLLTLTSHANEISQVICCSDTVRISVSWDRRVIVHEERPENDGGIVLRDSEVKDSEATCVAFCERMNLIAVGTRSHTVLLLSYNKAAYCADLSDHDGEITNVLFVESAECLLSADSEGCLYMWRLGARSGSGRYLCISRWWSTPHSITSLLFHAPDHHLIVGDEQGRIQVWSLKGLLAGTESRATTPLAGSTQGEAKEDWSTFLTEVEKPKEEIKPRPRSGGKKTPPQSVRSGKSKEVAEEESFWDDEEDMEVDSENAEHPVMLLSWQAHDDSVSSLNIIKDTDFLLSSGLDRTAKLWNRRDGSSQGMLHVSRSDWRFTQEITSRATTQAKALAVEMTKNIRNNPQTHRVTKRPSTTDTTMSSQYHHHPPGTARTSAAASSSQPHTPGAPPSEAPSSPMQSRKNSSVQPPSPLQHAYPDPGDWLRHNVAAHQAPQTPEDQKERPITVSSSDPASREQQLLPNESRVSKTRANNKSSLPTIPADSALGPKEMKVKSKLASPKKEQALKGSKSFGGQGALA